jgi:signal transduction histidine kinase
MVTDMAGARLLVVDDQAGGREALRELLAEDGFVCFATGDGAAVRDLVVREKIDLVLLDISMPDVGGLQVLEQLRAMRSALELPVIMVTAHSESVAVVGALKRGANDYVTKPIDPDVLAARIRTQLEIRDLSRLKDELRRIASHDLKNPLAVVIGTAELLAEELEVGVPMTDEGRAHLETIARRCRQMLRLINDFLDMRAVEAGRLALRREPTDLRELAGQSVHDQRAYAARKGIGLTLAGGAAAPLTADVTRVGQVIDNLVGNALKFGPRGGLVEVHVEAGAETVRFEVRDDGPGLPFTELERLFVAHSQVGNRPTGGESSSGLGLAWCRQLVELHGGRIGAQQRPGGGAVFWFELPRAAVPR